MAPFRITEAGVFTTRETDGRVFRVLCAEDTGQCAQPAVRVIECVFCGPESPGHARCAEHGL